MRACPGAQLQLCKGLGVNAPRIRVTTQNEQPPAVRGTRKRGIAAEGQRPLSTRSSGAREWDDGPGSSSSRSRLPGGPSHPSRAESDPLTVGSERPTQLSNEQGFCARPARPHRPSPLALTMAAPEVPPHTDRPTHTSPEIPSSNFGGPHISVVPPSSSRETSLRKREGGEINSRPNPASGF